jgi:hypothetical protein
MKPKQIQRKTKVIHDKCIDLNKQLVELQELCQHPDLNKQHGSNTGNYDPSVDIYWTDYFCPDCNKSWRGTQY